MGTGVVLQQPRVHALPVKAVSTGDNPQLLGRERGHSLKGGQRRGQCCLQPGTCFFLGSPAHHTSAQGRPPHLSPISISIPWSQGPHTGSTEKEMAPQPSPTITLSVKGRSTQKQASFWLMEEGSHVHATQEGRPKPCANADRPPGGVEKGPGTAQDHGIFGKVAASGYPNGDEYKRICPKLVIDRWGSKGVKFSCPLLPWVLNTHPGHTRFITKHPPWRGGDGVF